MGGSRREQGAVPDQCPITLVLPLAQRTPTEESPSFRCPPHSGVPLVQLSTSCSLLRGMVGEKAPLV